MSPVPLAGRFIGLVSVVEARMAEIVDFVAHRAARLGYDYSAVLPACVSASDPVAVEAARLAAADTPFAVVIDALADLVDKARDAGSISDDDRIEFAVYALVALGPGWELRSPHAFGPAE